MVKIAICDDMENDREKVAKYVKAYFEKNPYNFQIFEFDKGSKLVADYIDEYMQYDLIFLDIFINDEHGMDIAKAIRKYSSDVKIIFMSTSSEFALESYDVFAYSYLLKPVHEPKITMLMDKYIKESQESQRKLTVTLKGKILNICYADIVYIESKNTAIIIHKKNGEDIKIYDKLCNVERKLNNKRFLRCHQSYIINMDYVNCVDTEFKTITDDRVLIRKRSLREIKDKYYKYTIEKIEC